MSNDQRPSHPPRWFCHACECYFRRPIGTQDPHCVNCDSSFVEELASIDQDPPLRRWPSDHTHQFFGSFHHDDDSPPIPSTRQRYEQQQNQHQPPPQPQSTSHANRLSNLIDPLINMLSSPALPDPPDTHPDPSPSHPRPSNRSGPDSFSNVGDFFAQHYSAQTFTSTTPFSRWPAGNDDTAEGNQSDHRSNPNRSTSPRPPPQGIYTFAFGSQSSNPNTPHRTPGEPPVSSDNGRPPNGEGFLFGTGTFPHQPLNGILSLVQSALGLNTSGNSTPATDHRAAGSGDESSSPENESAASQQSGSSPPMDSPGNPTRSNEDPTPDGSDGNPRPTPRSPRVNLEESHPLRQFINILNSLNQANPSISRNGVNGFVINGGTGFGFATQFEMGQNSPFGHNLGDYVTSDTAMQDILNQLINLTGANGAHNPIPASESAIKSQKRFKFDSSRFVDDEPIECAICKDTFVVGDDCMELPCKHFFHDEDCISLWLKQNGSCPVCRYSLVNNRSDSGESEANQNARSESSTSASGEGQSQSSPRATQGASNSDPRDHHNRTRSQSSHSSEWTDHWEVVDDQLGPQFDFD